MIKVVSFDLDGTLVTQRFGDMVWNHGIPLEFSKKYGIPFDEAKRIIVSEYDSVGEESPLWYDIDYWISRFGLKIDAKELLDRYENFIELRDGATEVLNGLKGKFRLVLSTNASRVFVEKELTYSGLKRFFDFTFSATSDFGLVKKEVEFYRRILESLGVREDEIVHVGDNEIFDYQVPMSLGIFSILVDEKESLTEVFLRHEEMFQMRK